MKLDDSMLEGIAVMYNEVQMYASSILEFYKDKDGPIKFYIVGIRALPSSIFPVLYTAHTEDDWGTRELKNDEFVFAFSSERSSKNRTSISFKLSLPELSDATLDIIEEKTGNRSLFTKESTLEERRKWLKIIEQKADAGDPDFKRVMNEMTLLSSLGLLLSKVPLNFSIRRKQQGKSSLPPVIEG